MKTNSNGGQRQHLVTENSIIHHYTNQSGNNSFDGDVAYQGADPHESSDMMVDPD